MSTAADGARVGSVALPRVMSPTKTDPKLLSRMSTFDMMAVNHNKTLSVRDRIREMHALKMAPFPTECRRESTVIDATPASLASTFPCCRHPINAGPVETSLHLDLHGLSWKRRHIPTNDILGATCLSSSSQFVVHYVEKTPDCHFRTVQFDTDSDAEAAAWVDAIQRIVKWHARVPLDATRRLQVVLDTTATSSAEVWATAQTSLSLAAIDCTVIASEDCVSFGQTIQVGNPFEACLIVGTTLSFHRIVNGIFQQHEGRWRAILPSLPLGLLATTDPSTLRANNAAVLYNLIKRKIRPTHAVACHFNQEFIVLATDSIALGQTTLQMTLASQAPMPSVQYQCKRAPVDSASKPDPATPDNDDPNVNLQHHVELCSIYNDIDPALKSWKGSIACNQDVQNEPTLRTLPLLGLHMHLTQRHQAIGVQQFTPGPLWHRWTQHHRPINLFSNLPPITQASSLVLALPHAWDVSIDASPTRLVCGHIQFDCLPHLLHCFM
ncbi:hypothetical protein H310_05544 [Aphanomyces invadans]|uniref:PH domain-containing protein n=1 Tax=Aphanomyces invadans TaxID=157072 RepID=A0A024UA77_9STRA|nr:hypothetical protein H310_05544 [Aphanomyces invadans]ETW03120.1 hypothetical protein H310_05544 [Aphanomyces invadans]|eukprot:XP_008868504.1 hypothetical protein H310_05544 [Aphanomyces invadans]